MKRGLSPIVSMVLVIAIIIISGVALVNLSGDFTTVSPEKTPFSDLHIKYIGGNKIMITNTGLTAINVTSLRLSASSKLICNSNTLYGGDETICEIENTTKGAIVVYGNQIESALFDIDTGLVNPPKIESVNDNHTFASIGDTIRITARISDNIYVKNVTLYYKSPSDTSWKTKEMELVSGTASNGTWDVDLNFNNVGVWRYYILAYDNEGNPTQSYTYSFTIVISFIAPTPKNDTSLSTDDIIMNFSVASPNRVTVNLDGNNFTVYSSNEWHYFNFDNLSEFSGDIGSEYRRIYHLWMLGYTPSSGTPEHWYGENVELGDNDWVGSTIKFAKSTISSPIADHMYTLMYNDSNVWNLTNMTNFYVDIKTNLSSSSFNSVDVALIDTNGQTVVRHAGTYNANSRVYIWSAPNKKPVRQNWFFTQNPNFNWSAVDAYELRINASSTDPFTMQMGPARIAYWSNTTGEGVWGSKGLDVLSGKELNGTDWAWTGYAVYGEYDISTLNPKNYTLSVWIKYNNTALGSTIGILEMFGSDWWCDGISLSEKSSELKARIGHGYCSTDHYSNDTYLTADWSNFTDEKWHMITLTENGTHVELYIDGNKIDEDDMPAPVDIHIISGMIGTVGASISWENYPFWGQIDELHIVNRSLTPTEIQMLYHTEYGKYYAEVHNLSSGPHNFTGYADTLYGNGNTETRWVQAP